MRAPHQATPGLPFVHLYRFRNFFCSSIQGPLQGLLMLTSPRNPVHMKPNTTPPGAFFNFDAIPLWLYPDLWDENKVVSHRGIWLVSLYTISFLAVFALVFGLIALFIGSQSFLTIFWIWLAVSTPCGLLSGIGALGDFSKRSREIKEANSVADDSPK